MLVALASCAAALALPPAASANSTLMSFAFSDGSYGVSVSAATGKQNRFDVVHTGTTITVTDPADPIDAGPPCTGSGTNTVQCDFGGIPISSVFILAGDLDDSIHVEVSGSPRVLLEGGDGGDELTLVTTPGTTRQSELFGDDSSGNPAGDGNDTITGSDTADAMFAGGGADVLLGGDGDDGLVGGPGDGDRLEGGAGDDGLAYNVGDGGESFDGGPGEDTLSSFSTDPPGVFTAALEIDLAAGTVRQTAGGSASLSATNFEGMFGLGIIFTVTGTDGPNRLDTGAADDVVNPRAGADRVTVGAGADRVFARDGFGDRINCGADVDTVEVDQFDELFDCENVDLAQVLPAGVDLDAPVCTLSGVRRKMPRKRFLGRGLRPELECNEAVSFAARLTVPVRSRRGRLVTARAGQLVLAEQARSLSSGPRRIRLAVPRSLRRVLGHRFAATLRLVARDQFGNPRVLTRVVRVR